MRVGKWNNRSSHLLPVGMQNGIGILENSLAVSYKSKHSVTIRSSYCDSWYLCKGAEGMSTQNLHMMFMTCPFIVAQIQMQLRCSSVDPWIKKLVTSDNGI